MDCSHRHLFQRKNSLNKLLSDFFQQKAKSLTLNNFIKFKDRNTNDFFLIWSDGQFYFIMHYYQTIF